MSIEVELRAHRVDHIRSSGPCPRVLRPGHLRTLRHLATAGVVSGWENWWDHSLMELEAWGLVRGEWIGTLQYPPHPYWSITETGRGRLPERKESL
jgi:hypothetical protein